MSCVVRRRIQKPAMTKSQQIHAVLPDHPLNWHVLIKVLHRKKFPFTEERIRPVLASIRAFGLHVNPSPTDEILPDMDDLVFYEVVMEKREDDAYLVTGNLRHFPLEPFIVTPRQMLEIVMLDHMED